MLKKLFLLACLFVACPVTAHAQFTLNPGTNEGFEYADMTTLQTAFDHNCGAADSAQSLNTNLAFVHAGTKSLKHHFIGHDVGSHCSLGRDLTGVGTTLFTRVWIYIVPGFQVDGTTTKMLSTNANGSTGSVNTAGGISSGHIANWLMFGDFGNNRYFVAVQNIVIPSGKAGDTENVNDGPIPTGQFVCIEQEQTLSTPGVQNGIIRAWLTNAAGVETQILNKTNQRWIESDGTAGNWSSIGFFIQNGIGDIYFDDFRYGSTRTQAGGCGGTPTQAPDTTAPATPSAPVLTASSTGTVSLALTPPADSGGSGLAGQTIKYCTGAACTPTIVLTTASATATTALHSGVSASTVYGYSYNGFDGAGNQGAFSPIAYVTTPAAVVQIVTGSDTFIRADASDLGANWTGAYVVSAVTQSNLIITSNKVQSGSAVVDSLETYNTAPANDQWAQVTYSHVTPSSSAPGIMMRAANSPTYNSYNCRTTAAANSRIEKRVAGANGGSVTSSSSWVWADGDISRCEVTGAATVTINHYAIRNGVSTLLNTYTDSSSPYTSGKVGLVTFDAVPSQTQLNNFSFGGWGVPTPPAFTGISGVTRTQATLTCTDCPTYVRVAWEGGEVIETYATAFVAGTYTYRASILPTLTTYICFYPQDAAGVEQALTADAYRCGSMAAAATDTTAPVLATAFPMISLPAGTTSTPIVVTSDEPALLRWSLTDIAYNSMTNALSPAAGNLTHTFTGTGLTDGSTTTYYIRGADTIAPTPNIDSASLTVTVTVAAAPKADTTAPTTVTNLTAAVVSSTQIQLSHTASTDAGGAVSYQAMFSTDGVTYTQAKLYTGTTTATIDSLTPGTLYYFKIMAYDPSLNPAAAFSNVATGTTPAAVDITPPTAMSDLGVTLALQNSVLLGWTKGVDNRGTVTSIIEQCTVTVGTTCTSFAVAQAGITDPFINLQRNLVASTRYCWRGMSVDASGNRAADYSATACATTAASGVGLQYPRIPVPFSQPRSAITTPRSAITTPRP